MAEDTWTDGALHILEFVSANELSPNRWTIPDIASELGLDSIRVLRELERLRDGDFIYLKMYVSGGKNRDEAQIMEIRLLERGAKQVGQWPSDNLYAALLSALDERIVDTPPGKEKARLDKLRESLAAIGTTVVSELLVRVAIGVIH